MAWYYILLLFAYCGTIISIVAVVLSENRNPVKSLAWITVLLTVPVFGFVLYIFFGRSLKNTRMIRVETGAGCVAVRRCVMSIR